MKKLLITTAVMLMAVIVSSKAYAGLDLFSTNATFSFNPDSATPTSFNVFNNNGTDNGLNDMAIYLGYRTDAGGGTQNTQYRLLSGGTDNPGSSTIGPTNGGTQSNFGSFSFDAVTFTDPNNNGGGNVTVTPTIDFRLSDVSPTSSPTAANQAATVLYELSLDTQGVNGDNQGSVLSFVGFDFNGNGLEEFVNGEQIVGGFTNNAAAQAAIGDVTNANRVLSGDFNFEQSVGGSTAPGTNTNVDLFNGAVNNQSTASTSSPAANPSFLDLRTNGGPEFRT